MESWMNELVKVLGGVLAGPDTAAQMWSTFAVAVLSCVVIMRLTAGAFGLRLPTLGRALPATLVPVILSLAAVIALRLYLLNKVDSAAVRLACQIGVAVLIALAVAVPMQCFLFKGNYLAGLLNLCAALIIAALITVAFRAGWQAVTSGKSSVLKAKERNELLDSETQQQ